MATVRRADAHYHLGYPGCDHPGFIEETQLQRLLLLRQNVPFGLGEDFGGHVQAGQRQPEDGNEACFFLHPAATVDLFDGTCLCNHYKSYLGLLDYAVVVCNPERRIIPHEKEKLRPVRHERGVSRECGKKQTNYLKCRFYALAVANPATLPYKLLTM